MLQQLDLFETGDFHLGMILLNEFRIKEGLRRLKQARPIWEEEQLLLKRVKETAVFWWDKLTQYREDKRNAAELRILLYTWNKFWFVDQIGLFKRALIRYFAEEIEAVVEDEDRDVKIQCFFLLMEEEMYGTAETMIVNYLEKYPREVKYLYLQGWAEWKAGHKGKANTHWLQAFLVYPERAMMRFVLSKKLSGCAAQHPLEMVPAYAWLNGEIGFVSLDDQQFTYWNDRHERAIKAYAALKRCHKALKKREIPIANRKELQSYSPDLYEAYMGRRTRS